MAKPRKIGEKIKEMRANGIGFNEIVRQLKCSRNTVQYHISKVTREKTRIRSQKYKKSHPFVRKMERFKEETKTPRTTLDLVKVNKAFYNKGRDFCRNLITREVNMSFSMDELKNKLGENPRCYLTGESIDISKTRSYHFDHILPRSRGGDNSLDNLGICTARANKAKNDMTPDELYEFCQKVVKHYKPKVE